MFQFFPQVWHTSPRTLPASSLLILDEQKSCCPRAAVGEEEMWSPDFAHSSELLMHSPQDSKELVQHSNRAAEPILQQTFVLPGPQCNSPVGRSGGYHCPQITIPTLLGTELSWTNLPSIPQQPVPSHSSLCVMYSRLRAKVLPKRYQKRGRTSGRFGARNPNSLWL